MIEQIIKYSLVTAGSYAILVAGTYILVELINFDQSFAYAFMISFVYFLVYIANFKLVFPTTHKKSTVYKYILTLAIFWFFNNLFFNLMVKGLNVQYIIAASINILFFGLIRFFVQRNFVFK